MVTDVHPMGPYNPTGHERYERQEPKVMRPRPDWNALGPYIDEDWRRRLKAINPRFELQFFPDGRIAGSPERGFWAVCLQLPHSKMLYKQTVLSLVDAQGRRQHPSLELLGQIKEGWHVHRHEGMDAVFDSIDENMAREEAARHAREEQELLDRIEKSIGTGKIKYRDPAKIVVPG